MAAVWSNRMDADGKRSRASSSQSATVVVVRIAKTPMDSNNFLRLLAASTSTG